MLKYWQLGFCALFFALVGCGSGSQPSLNVTTTNTGTATLTWTPPTTNTDGSALTNLAGFRIYYGTAAGQLNQEITVSDATSKTYTISGLASGTWYFAVTAYNSSGGESAHSNVGSKTIP